MHDMTALITGASSGIGEACAKELARRGCDLVITARSRDRLEALKQAVQRMHGVAVTVLVQDLAQPDAALELYRQAQGMGIEIDILVNNAGFGDFAAFLDSDWDKQYDMIAVNITALMQMTYLFGRDMRTRGHGRILNLASVTAFGPGPYMPVYYAAKAFVLSFSQALAEELDGTGVTVTALCPGPTNTNFPQAANTRGSHMFTAFHNASPEQVARAGCHAALNGKPVAIHSLLGHVMNAGSHLLPKKAARKLAKKINGVPGQKKPQ